MNDEQAAVGPQQSLERPARKQVWTRSVQMGYMGKQAPLCAAAQTSLSCLLTAGWGQQTHCHCLPLFDLDHSPQHSCAAGAGTRDARAQVSSSRRRQHMDRPPAAGTTRPRPAAQGPDSLRLPLQAQAGHGEDQGQPRQRQHLLHLLRKVSPPCASWRQQTASAAHTPQQPACRLCACCVFVCVSCLQGHVLPGC